MVRSPLVTIAAFATFAVVSCGAAPGVVAGPTPVEAQALTVHESCGRNFTVRDAAGTTRLTIVTGIGPSEGRDPGTFEFGLDGARGGSLELGSGLDVWPCHDVSDDFDGENIQETWTVIGGSIELLDPVVPGHGGGSSPVRALVNRVEIESGDGEVIVLEGIEVFNPSWGFFGG